MKKNKERCHKIKRLKRNTLKTIGIISIVLVLVGYTGTLAFGSINSTRAEAEILRKKLHPINHLSLASLEHAKNGVAKTKTQNQPDSTTAESISVEKLKNTGWLSTVEKNIRESDYDPVRIFC